MSIVGGRLTTVTHTRRPEEPTPPAWRGPGLPPETRAPINAEWAYLRRSYRRGELFGMLGFVVFGGFFGLRLVERTVLAVLALGLSVDREVRKGRINTAGLGPRRARAGAGPSA